MILYQLFLTFKCFIPLTWSAKDGKPFISDKQTCREETLLKIYYQHFFIQDGKQVHILQQNLCNVNGITTNFVKSQMCSLKILLLHHDSTLTPNYIYPYKFSWRKGISSIYIVPIKRVHFPLSCPLDDKDVSLFDCFLLEKRKRYPGCSFFTMYHACRLSCRSMSMKTTLVYFLSFLKISWVMSNFVAVRLITMEEASTVMI